MSKRNVRFKKKTVLINSRIASAIVVDDDPSSRLLITKALHRMGIEALSSENGEAALTILHTHPGINLVITDIEMPVMNGYEVVKSITHLNRTSSCHTEIVVMSSIEPSDYYNKMGEYPIKGFIQKPVRLTNLSSLLAV